MVRSTAPAAGEMTMPRCVRTWSRFCAAKRSWGSPPGTSTVAVWIGTKLLGVQVFGDCGRVGASSVWRLGRRRGGPWSEAGR